MKTRTTALAVIVIIFGVLGLLSAAIGASTGGIAISVAFLLTGAGLFKEVRLAWWALTTFFAMATLGIVVSLALFPPERFTIYTLIFVLFLVASLILLLTDPPKHWS